MTKHLRFLIVLLMTLVWSTGGAQTTIWSEDWTGGKDTQTPSTFKPAIYTQNSSVSIQTGSPAAGGNAPELMIKSKSSWTVKITDLKGCKGDVTLTLKTNQKSRLSVSVGSSTINLTAVEGQDKTFSGTFNVNELDVPFNIVFKNTATGKNNLRLDDISLIGTSVEESKTATKVSFGSNSGQTFTFTEGEYTDGTFTAPTATEIKGVEGTIVYSSNNESAVTVDASTGALSFPGYGEATITATFTPKDADTYAESTDSYKVVNKADLSDFVFYESFDKCAGKGGNDGTFKNTGTDKVLSDNTGWSFTNEYGANKCVKLGTGSNSGSAETPAINLSGKGLLTFKVASWDGDNSEVNVSVDNGTLIYNGKEGKSFVLSPTDTEWNDINMIISMTGSVKVKFYSTNKRFFLDEVMVKDIPTVILDETVANNNIVAKTGVNVTLKRTMKADMWNTICLPFDVTMDKAKAAFGDNVKIVELDTKAAVDANVLSFKTSTGIEAATPYLIKPSAVADDYTFENVDITNKAADYSMTSNVDVVFKGIYNMVDITKDVVDNVDASCYAAFLGAGNKIYKASTGMTKGFRAYFAIPNSASTSALCVVIDGTATSIKNIDSEVVESNAPVYNLQGQRVDGNSLTPGIYVKAGKKFVVK